MKKYFFLLVGLAIYGFCFSQSLSREVVGSAGDVFVTAGGALEWTLGEFMTETFVQNSSVLTQGFHQPETEAKIDLTGYAVFPNPVSDYLTVRVVKKGSYNVELFNILGQKSISKTVNLNLDNATFQIDMKILDSALYLLRIVNTDKNESIFFKIEKI